jgi:acyl-CoA thioesterase
MEQEGQLCVLATGAFSEDFAGDAAWSESPPVAPPAAQVQPVPAEQKLVPIARRFDVRPALGPAPFTGADEARTGGWIAFAEGDDAPLDAPALAMLTDAWLPAAFTRLAAPMAVPTVDLTIHFRAPDVAASWPALVEFRSRFAHGGFFEEDGEVWSADGRLLAQSRQLGLLL